MEKLKNLFATTLNINPATIDNELSRQSEAAWDSFTHLLLISEIEKAFNITLSMHETNSIHTYKELKALIASKL